MKKLTTIAHFALAGLLTFNCSVNALAQQRSVDLEVIMVEPNETEVFKSGQTISLSIAVTNHGPDQILVGDSLFAILPDGSPTWGTMTTSVAVGGTTDLFSTEITLPTVSSNSTIDLCVQLADDPSTQITMGGSPVSVSYKDPIPGNNVACRELTVEGEPSSIMANSRKNALLPFPNPATNFIQIPIENWDTDVFILIKDLSGRTVFDKLFPRENGGESIKVNVEHLKEGVYLIERYDGETYSMGKITILR